MPIFTQLAVITVLAALLGMMMNRLKQPMILGYILAGLLASAWGWFQSGHQELIISFGEIGVTLLLFLVGMELSWPKMHALGRTALLTGLGQIIFTFLGGLGLAWLLGFNFVIAVYIAMALTFSSTIVVIKLLGEKNDLQSLHGRISVGILLLQDIAAIFLLVLLPGLAHTGDFSGMLILGLLIKFILLTLGVLLVSKYVVPRLIDEVAHSSELLFIVSLAWGVGLAAFLSWEPIGFSIEVGGFVAGVTLAKAMEHQQILSRIRPLRDFFVMLFFVSLGASISIGGLGAIWLPVLIFSLFVLVGNPLIVLLIMSGLKYKVRTAWFTSLTMGQISEFGLILTALGLKLGQVNESIVALVAIVAVITMLGSSYMMLHADKLWKKNKSWLKRIEQAGGKDFGHLSQKKWENHVVLIGCDRTGRLVWKKLKKLGVKVVIVDFNPEIVRRLADEGAEVTYGDAEDMDILEDVGVSQAKMVVSTVVDMEATLGLLEYLINHKNRKKILAVVTASYPEEAKLFYEKGADFVAVPREMTGRYLGEWVGKKMIRN